MKVRFDCPKCDAPQRVTLTDALEWMCNACQYEQRLAVPAAVDERPLAACTVCGCHELYRQKNFPHWLGLTLLAAACGAFFILSGLYEKWLAWTVLLGSAAFDAGMYMIVGDAVSCYRCGANHTGLNRCKKYDPFDLPIAEKYRQERLRREQHSGKN